MTMTAKSSLTRRCLVSALVLEIALLVPAGIRANPAASLQQQLHRIFEKKDYEIKRFGPARWLEGGRSYVTVEPSAAIKDASDLVVYDTATGLRRILVSASRLIPPGATAPLSIDGYALSTDRSRLLLFTNSKKVWRRNTRGDDWVLDIDTGLLHQIGKGARPSSLMFAKFSPDGRRVAYVRENNLYVEDPDSGRIIALTRDGSDTLINGTSDWVDEEELDIRDGFRWSPNSQRIAFWQFDTSGVGVYTLIDDTDALYPTLKRFAYPKVGTTNSAVRIGVVSASGGPVRFLDVPGDPRDFYIARLEWAGKDSKTLALEKLNRLQNQSELLLADAETGRIRTVYRDISKTWIDVNDRVRFIDGGRAFLWESEKDGWRHVYRVSRDGSRETLLTAFDGDVIEIAGVDEKDGWLYFLTSPDNATQKYLYRARLDGRGGLERVTPTGRPGTHTYDLSPDRRWAFHTESTFDRPPTTDLVRMPEHRPVRSLSDNAAVESKAADLLAAPSDFFHLPIEDGAILDAWMIRPASFDPARKYPLLVYVYGEPAGQTVLDAWGGDRELFHRALANTGIVVASFDNRGTPAPKGAAWRKIIYGSIGHLSSKEQAEAVRALCAARPYLDCGRVAVWGWSGGGSSTLNAMFRYPDLYKVGVAVAPVPDQRLYDTIYQERYMGLPKDNAEGYRIGSPINFADGLKGKLLIVHGSGDDNVHFQGTERLINRLVELDKPFDLMVYPNRTHAISEGKGTRLHIYSLIARYIRENL
jgi:dipeptidyl-peptidase 4